MKLDKKHLLLILCSIFLVVLVYLYVNSCNQNKNVVVAHNDDNVKTNENKKLGKQIWSNVNKLKNNNKNKNNNKKNKSENVKDFNHNNVMSDKANFNSQSTLGQPEEWEMSGVYWHSAKAATKGM